MPARRSTSMTRLPGTSESASPVSVRLRSERTRSGTAMIALRGGCPKRNASSETWMLATTMSRRKRSRKRSEPQRVDAPGEGDRRQREAVSTTTASDQAAEMFAQVNVAPQQEPHDHQDGRVR